MARRTTEQMRKPKRVITSSQLYSLLYGFDIEATEKPNPRQ